MGKRHEKRRETSADRHHPVEPQRATAGRTNGKANGRNGAGAHLTLADKADRYALYQKAVQCPETEVAFFDRVYRQAYRRTPILLREDFCGTAAVSCQWVRSAPRRRAYGVDLDPEPLAWGATHNVARLAPAAKRRLQLVQGDVRRVRGDKADVIAAQNFSFFVFKDRKTLGSYFRSTRRNLAERGVLVLDMFGGSEVLVEDHQESSKIGKGAKYVWDQHRFDPISHNCTFFIHFRFKDGSKLKQAFRYDWRLWSVPEVRELLSEAGFSKVDVYWEGTDPETGDGNGEYTAQAEAESDPAWIAYIVAMK